MTTVEEIRRENLERLRKQFKTLAALNRALGRDHRDGTFSQILNRASHTQSGNPRVMGSQLARDIEIGLKLPEGWMDQSHDDTGAMPAADPASMAALAHAESLRPGEMWLPMHEGVHPAMGDGGGDGNATEVVTLVRVAEETLRRRLAATIYSSLRNLRLVTARGQSMAPTFQSGDVLIVDAGVNEIREDGVYVYSRDDRLFCKRLQIEGDGSVRVISDNPQYRDSMIARQDLEQYRVHGRVLSSWNFNAHA